MKPIITCDLPLPIQRLYIKRLKHMIWRWEFENFCGHCPVNKKFGHRTGFIKKFKSCQYDKPYICEFCQQNVGLFNGCPCYKLKRQEALKRAKDFVGRFEAEDE